MVIYILKFSACLAVLMLFYKLILEQSSIHKFKRFYLLGALIVALTIPSLTFIEYIEPVTVGEFTTFVVPDFEMTETTQEVLDVDYTPIILWSLYVLGVLIFLLKFCFNLNNIISRIKSNPKLKSKGFINVLVSNLRIPHTFFNYIFFDKKKYELGDIPHEVLIHEQTHAKQKHSIDVLLLELLQIIFWFNPLIYLLKREVKLNHEYLADQAVLQNGIQPSTYQTILLAFSSKVEHQELANAINYSSIKKRFTVMKTHTSKTSIWLRSLLILPVLAILLYGFTEREQVERESVQSSIENEPLESQIFNLANSKQLASISNSEIELFIDLQGELLYNDEIIALEDLSSIYTLENDINISLKTTLDADKELISAVTKRIQKFLRTQGLKTFSVCVSAENNDKQEGLSAKQLNEYNRLAKYYNNQPINKRIIKKVEIEKLEGLYSLMSDAQKEKAQPFPSFPPPPPPPPILSAKQLEEYNKLAKKYNDKPLKDRIIKVKDYEYLEGLYQAMSKEQKESSQPFPSFPPVIPPPPPPPAETKTGFIEINNELYYYVEFAKQTKYFNNKGFLVSKEGKTISKSRANASDIIPGQYITKVYVGNEVFVEFEDNKPHRMDDIVDSPPPPPPAAAPKSTLDFAIELAKKNAKFYFNKKEISSDEAFSILKKNPEFNLLAKNTDKAQPLVYISKEPIKINK